MLPLMLQLILFAFLLVINGEPSRSLLIRRLKLFSNLDFAQICILDIYLGGLILYVIAMLPLRLFDWAILFLLTIMNFLLSVLVHFKTLTRVTSFDKIKVSLKENKKVFFDYVLVFLMFIIFLFINLLSVSDLVLGSVHDESIHSLDVEVILENNHVPVTLQPYLPEGIIYPQASHVIFAFASRMLNLGVPQTVFYVSILFKALSLFGAYFLGKELGSSRAYCLGLSFVFAFISSWPLSVVWGGNPFLVGFPLFLVCLGLLFSMFCFCRKNSFAELIVVGLLFGYLSSIIFSYVQTLIMVALLIFIYYLVRNRSRVYHTLLEFVAIFSVSLLLLSPFLFRFFAFYQYPGHNIGTPSDFAGWRPQQLYITQALQWAFENLSPYVLLRMIIVLILVYLAVSFLKTKNYKNMKSQVAFALAIFVAAALLSFISFFLSPDFNVISWGHQGVLLTIPINILIVAFYVKLVEFCHGGKLKKLFKICQKNSHATLLLTIMLLSAVTVPFLYYRFLVDPGTLRSTYGLFAIATQDDYNLMMWMSGNVSSNAIILVNPYEVGLFIPSISHNRIIFPHSGSSFSSSYQTLVSLLNFNVLNETTHELMQYWNISHVFIGSNVAYWWLENLKWNPKLLLGNPNFKLVKNFGNAYLFQLNATNSNIVFLDDFEYSLWSQNGWQTNYVGNGLGNVAIATDFGYNASRCLIIRTQALPTVVEWKYARWVRREIFVQNNSRVTLSFYFNATEGFNDKDTFAALISNAYNNESVVFTIPNGIYASYKNAKSLEGFTGEFDLSSIWHELFNSTLPNPFILEFVNYDFDGIENVVYIDNITITATPLD